MPRIKNAHDPYERYKVLLAGTMQVRGIDNEDLARLMEVSRQTMAAKLDKPESMKLGFVRRLHRVLGIRAEDARAALPVV